MVFINPRAPWPGAQTFNFHQLTLASASDASRLHAGEEVSVLRSASTDLGIRLPDGTLLRGTDGSAGSPVGWLLLAASCIVVAGLSVYLARTASIEALRGRSAARE